MSTSNVPRKSRPENPRYDLEQIRQAVNLLLDPGQVYELRVPSTRHGTLSGYFDELDQLALAAANVSGRGPAVYLSINPVLRDLLSRSVNRMKEYVRHTTTDAQVIARHWFTVDFDAVRPSGISSTELEHQQALDRAAEVREWLSRSGWPDPVCGDSGNGGHLLYQVDLENDPAINTLLQNCLKAMAFHFDDETVTVDTATFNPGRPWKLYGTLVAKEDNTRERPHRLSRILQAPKRPEPVPLELLQTLAATLPKQPARSQTRYQDRSEPFDLDRWLAQHDIPVHHTAPWNGGQKWVLSQCIWNPTHADKSAYILRFSNGAIAAGCQHNSCQGQDWNDFREAVDPGRGERQGSSTSTPRYLQRRGNVRRHSAWRVEVDL